MTDIAALIARLEKASGADRQLDWEIATKVMGMKPAEGNQPDWTLAMAYDGYAEDALRPTPYYTASIDAALTLLPDGRGWLLGRGHLTLTEPPYGARICSISDPDIEYGVGEGSTPAIALCIACLRARSAI